MNQDSVEQYTQFLLKSQVNSYLIELSDPVKKSVKAVMLIDLVDDGLSAVYTFYEPEVKNSYGTYAILWAIEFAKQHQLPYLYLGYWIKESQKMNYKNRFFPSEVYLCGAWQAYSEKE
jgi:arginine-tRNA-protein transferase